MKFDSIKAYQDYFLPLIEKERKAQKEFFLNEIKTLSGKKRQELGRALLDLKGKKSGEFLDYSIYRFFKPNLNEHQIKVGDIVLISKGEPLKFNIEATVSVVAKNYIECFVSGELFKAKRYRVDLFVNDITFKRMEEAIKNLENSIFPYKIILGAKEPQIIQTKHFSKNLNDSQNIAFSKAVKSELFLIHGPYGTGKTTTLVEIIKALKGKKILVSADSNVAVDNLLERLLDFKVVRIGHPAKIDTKLKEHSLDYQITKHPKYKEIKELLKKIKKLKQLQDANGLKPTPANKRGLSEEEIIKFAKAKKAVRGIKISKLEKMKLWLLMQKKLNSLFEKKDKLTQYIINEIFESAHIVFATTSGAGSELLKEQSFYVAIIDEAAQAMEPSIIIAMSKAKQVLLAGDHKQLPPTILSNDKKLQISLFERFSTLYPKAMHTLSIQYRMNEKINHFPSCEFYNCVVKSDKSVANITMKDLGIKEEEFFGSVAPLVLFDTKGKFIETSKKGSTSKSNIQEAHFVKKLVDTLLRASAKEDMIGIITPYKDQEEYLKKLIANIEIKSVDGFQGREKEIIILSLVRSNEKENIGFLQDLRRLNVALTRAKRKLIIIADAKTLSSHPTYQRLITYCKKNGVYKEAKS